MISQPYRIKLETFLNEFIIDFNSTQAAIRMSISNRAAKVTGCKYLNDPYTQERLTSLLQRNEEEALVTRSIVLAGLLREGNSYEAGSTGNSRVAAWSKLAKLLGMEAQTKIEHHHSGVMLVPHIQNWENGAEATQTILKTEVKQKG